MLWDYGRHARSVPSFDDHNSHVQQLDSLLGATLQRTQYSNTTKRVLTDTSAVPDSKADIKVVSGFDILTNNQVRVLSVPLSGLLTSDVSHSRSTWFRRL